MNTWRRANNEIFHTHLQRNCTHPDSEVELFHLRRYQDLLREIYDTVKERMVCTICGLEGEMVDPTPTEDPELHRTRLGVRVKLLCGDVIEMLKTIPDGTVQTCVTSPPYYGLRITEWTDRSVSNNPRMNMSRNWWRCSGK